MKISEIPGTKQKIYTKKGQFNFGVDSILLSSFAKMKEGESLIDIGTGTGVLALRCQGLYQLGNVYAIEIQEKMSKMAQESVHLNGSDIKVIHGDIREMLDDFREIDNIIVNPPYIKKGSGINNLDEHQALSRMEVSMDLDDLFTFAHKSLKSKGHLFMIHRPHRLYEIFRLAMANGFSVRHLQMVYPNRKKAASMVLLHLIKAGGDHVFSMPPLIIYDEGNRYTKELVRAYEGK